VPSQHDASADLKTCALIFQEGPSERPDGTLDFCRDCPDATVRDGALVPICMADVERPVRAPRAPAR
jgi:hypothetical protein